MRIDKTYTEVSEVRARIKELQRQRRETGKSEAITSELAELRETEDRLWRISTGLQTVYQKA